MASWCELQTFHVKRSINLNLWKFHTVFNRMFILLSASDILMGCTSVMLPAFVSVDVDVWTCITLWVFKTAVAQSAQTFSVKICKMRKTKALRLRARNKHDSFLLFPANSSSPFEWLESWMDFWLFLNAKSDICESIIAAHVSSVLQKFPIFLRDINSIEKLVHILYRNFRSCFRWVGKSLNLGILKNRRPLSQIKVLTPHFAILRSFFVVSQIQRGTFFNSWERVYFPRSHVAGIYVCTVGFLLLAPNMGRGKTHPG